MKPTTLTTCDDNIPTTNLYLDEDALCAALLEHYQTVWKVMDAEGECPATWKEIHAELERRDLLRERHIAHLHTHELFQAAA